MALRTVVIDVCDRCIPGKEKPVANERVYSLEGRFYKLKLCQPHTDMFDREISTWTRLSEEIDMPAAFGRPRSMSLSDKQKAKAQTEAIRQAAEEARHHNASLDFVGRRAEEIDEQQRLLDELRVGQSIPGAMMWRLTTHARERMEQRGFTLEDVLMTATQPDHTYRQPWRGPHIAIYQRQDCRIAVDDVTRAVITVIDRNDTLESEPAGFDTNTIAVPSLITERKAL